MKNLVSYDAGDVFRIDCGDGSYCVGQVIRTNFHGHPEWPLCALYKNRYDAKVHPKWQQWPPPTRDAIVLHPMAETGITKAKFPIVARGLPIDKALDRRAEVSERNKREKFLLDEMSAFMGWASFLEIAKSTHGLAPWNPNWDEATFLPGQYPAALAEATRKMLEAVERGGLPVRRQQRPPRAPKPLPQLWAAIDAARQLGPTGNDRSVSSEALRTVLELKPTREVLQIAKQFYWALIYLNRWDIWGAGYVIQGGMSDDGFHCFRSWIIGRGQVAYDAALKDPDSLGDYISGDEDPLDNQELEDAPFQVLDSKGYTSDPRDSFDRSADDEPMGEQFDEANVFRAYPRLAARFWPNSD